MSYGYGKVKGEARIVPMDDSSRCLGQGMYGRCQLRGSVGSVGEGARLWCTWHHHAMHKPGTERTFQVFCEWLAAMKVEGCSAFDHRPAAEWWDLIQGKEGPGGFTSWSGEDMEKVQARRSKAIFAREAAAMKGKIEDVHIFLEQGFQGEPKGGGGHGKDL